MSYKEKKTIVSIITGLFILTAYFIYAYGNYHSGTIVINDMRFLAGTMLIFIGAGIVSGIIIQIVFHILFSMAIAVKENVRNTRYNNKEIEKTIEAEMVTDEMDKLIELKSMRICFITTGVGFITALVSLILSYSTAVMLNIVFVSFIAGSLLDGFSRLYFYRNGVKNA